MIWKKTSKLLLVKIELMRKTLLPCVTANSNTKLIGIICVVVFSMRTKNTPHW